MSEKGADQVTLVTTSAGEVSDTDRVSVIIPVWREDAALVQAASAFLNWPEVCEVIVAAAEETGRENIESAGLRWILAAPANRGRQMNIGARFASGRWLLFQHADTELTRAHLRALAAVPPNSVVGGAFYRRFDRRHPWCRRLERFERWHNRSFGTLYGDQSIFVRRDHFVSLGGFADIPLMEDVEFSRRLRRSGRVALLDPPVATSPRRHNAHGALRVTLQNAFLIALFHLGVAPDRLHAWYYRSRRTGTPDYAYGADTLARARGRTVMRRLR